MDVDGIAVAADFVVEDGPRREIRHVQNIVAHDATAFADAHQRSCLEQRNILETRNVLLVERFEFRHHLAAGDQMLRQRLLVQRVDAEGVAHVAARRMLADAEHAGMVRIVHREDAAVFECAHQLLMDVHGILLTTLVVDVAPQAAQRARHRLLLLEWRTRPCADVAVARAVDDHFRLDGEKSALRMADQLFDGMPFHYDIDDLRHQRKLHASLRQQLVVQPFHQLSRTSHPVGGQSLRIFHRVELVIDFTADAARKEVHAVTECHEHRHEAAGSHAAETGLALREKNAFARSRGDQRRGDTGRTAARHEYIDRLTDFYFFLIQKRHGCSFARPSGLFFY